MYKFRNTNTKYHTFVSILNESRKTSTHRDRSDSWSRSDWEVWSPRRSCAASLSVAGNILVSSPAAADCWNIQLICLTEIKTVRFKKARTNMSSNEQQCQTIIAPHLLDRQTYSCHSSHFVADSCKFSTSYKQDDIPSYNPTLACTSWPTVSAPTCMTYQMQSE